MLRRAGGGIAGTHPGGVACVLGAWRSACGDSRDGTLGIALPEAVRSPRTPLLPPVLAGKVSSVTLCSNLEILCVYWSHEGLSLEKGLV